MNDPIKALHALADVMRFQGAHYGITENGE